MQQLKQPPHYCEVQREGGNNMGRQKGEIVCDECGAVMEELNGLLRDHVIAQDEDGNEITERFFECPRCGHHYTVTVIDRNMRLMIQWRTQLKYRMNRILKNRGNKVVLQKLIDEDKAIQDDLKVRADALKKKYLEGGAI